MKAVQALAAFLAAVATTYLASTLFYTHQVIGAEQAVGGVYTTGQQMETFVLNLQGLWLLGAIIAVALFIGFLVAFVLKRIVKPLAMVAYPAAGAAAIIAAILIIENTMAPGNVGAIAGARGPLGLALQGLAGAFGGTVFALMRPR
jgi:hypothetical protein